MALARHQRGPSDPTVGVLALAAGWGAAAAAGLYALLHLLLVAALAVFGQRAGGYPLQPLGIAAYGLLVAGGTALALRAGARPGPVADRLRPLLALAPLLAAALVGAFFATLALGGLGQAVAFEPYNIDRDGQSAWLQAGLAVWVAAVALAVRWRGLLVGGMAGQALALALNPGLVGTLRWGWSPDYWPLLASPALYLGAAAALGWRPRPAHIAAAAGLLAGAVVVAASGMLVLFPDFRAALERWPPAAAQLPSRVLLTSAVDAAVAGLPLTAWWLRAWARAEEPPSALAAAGAGLALLGGAALLSWRYLVPGAGSNVLPAPGSVMGWIATTVPADAYGAPGDALFALAPAYPVVLGAAGVLWLAAAATAARRRRPRPGIGAGLAALGFATLYQSPVVVFFSPGPIPPVRGLAPALAGQERGLQTLLLFGFPLLGLCLLGLGAAVRGPAGPRRGWLVFAATLLALMAAALLTAGLVAGTLQELELHRRLGSPEYLAAARVRLVLSLIANAAFALVGWAMVAAGALALAGPGPAHLPAARVGRALALSAGALAAAGATAWWLTALPIAETLPPDGATGVPTNHGIVVRLAGERSWSPGICARYEDTDGCIPGRSGGMQGAALFAPEAGWRANARVEVRVCCGPATRSYWFSFTTGDGPAADVPPTPGKPGGTAPAYPPPLARESAFPPGFMRLRGA